MIIEVKIPSPGESITEVELGKWLVEDGAVVDKDDEIAEVESDKATLTITAGEGGKVAFLVHEGEKVAVGAVACTIDTSVQPQAIAKGESVQAPVSVNNSQQETKKEASKETGPKVKVTSVAQQMMDEHHLSLDDVLNGLRRISKKRCRSSHIQSGSHSCSFRNRQLFKGGKPGTHVITASKTK